MKDSLQNLFRQILPEYGKQKGFELPTDFEFEVAVSKDPAHGDFAVNAAFKLAKQARVKPVQIAEELKALIEKNTPPFIKKIEIAGGGFLNFYLNRSSLAQVLFEVRKQNQDFGKTDFGKGKKVLLEYVSANPTGPLTIAHGRQAAIGDCLARILAASGHQVHKEYYLNDAGRQMNLLGASLLARYEQELGKDTPLPEEGYQGDYLKDVAKQLIAEKGDSLLKEPKDKASDFCREYAGSTIMKGIRQDMEAVDVKFDSYFNESSLYSDGKLQEALETLKKGGYLFEQDGALWFRSTDFGDDKDRVIKKSTGDYTYLAPDIAYHHYKYKRGFNMLVNLLGPDHHGYIARLKAACQALGNDPNSLNVLIVQLSTLYRKGQPVRMSTRAGEFITLHELVQEVGPDAARFFFVMRKFESHLDFDLELAKEKSQENPVYYLQYGHARISSLLKKAERPVPNEADLSLLSTQEEADLIKMIGEFPQAIISASEALEPYRLSDYLRELAATFHKFYSFHRIITDDKALSDARLLLADATRIVLRNGLRILGISQPESM